MSYEKIYPAANSYRPSMISVLACMRRAMKTINVEFQLRRGRVKELYQSIPHPATHIVPLCPLSRRPPFCCVNNLWQLTSTFRSSAAAQIESIKNAKKQRTAFITSRPRLG